MKNISDDLKDLFGEMDRKGLIDPDPVPLKNLKCPNGYQLLALVYVAQDPYTGNYIVRRFSGYDDVEYFSTVEKLEDATLFSSAERAQRAYSDYSSQGQCIVRTYKQVTTLTKL